MNINNNLYNNLGKEMTDNINWKEYELQLKADLLACKYVKNVINSYNKTNKHKYKNDYVLSIDKNETNAKFFILFETINDMINFIDENKYKNLYEIITKDIVKPYFDIDYKKDYTTKANIKLFISQLKNEFNNYFNKSITENDILTYTKHDKDDINKITSIHIIINGVMISKNNNKLFCNMINKKRSGIKKTLKSAFDTKIYTDNRQFSLPYQNKLGKSIAFEPYDETHDFIDNVKYYLINNTIDCKYTDCKSNDNIEEINKMENKIIQNHNNEKQNEDNKIINQEANKNIKVFNLNRNNIIDILIDNLPSDFYTSDNNNWTLLSRQLYFNECNNYDEWVKHSAEQSNYTEEDNNNWSINQDDKYISTNLQKYLDLINNNHATNKYGEPTKYLWDFNCYFYDELKNWICDKTNITIQALNKIIINNQEAVKKNQKSIDKIEIGNGFTYYIKKELLINELQNNIYHYGYDTGFNNQYGLDDTIFKTIKQDEIIDTTEQFLNNDSKLCGFKMLWGTGKTYYGVNTINKWRDEKKYRMVMITENNTLNADMTAKLDGVSHLNKDINNYDDYDVIITSMESLHKIIKNTNNSFDIIVFDEYESVINHFLSTTYTTAKTTPFEVSKLFKTLIYDATKIICLDCDLSIKRMSLLKKVIEDDNDFTEMQLYNCDFNNWKDYEYNLHLNLNKMKCEMETNIYTNDKKIIYASTSKTEALGVYRRIYELNIINSKNKNVMILTRNGANNDDGIKYIHNGIKYSNEKLKELQALQSKYNNDLNKYSFKITTDDLTDDERNKIIDIKKELETINDSIKWGKYIKLSRDKIIENLERIIIDLNIDVLIYSPTIKCGISIGNDETNLLFDMVYSYATNGSITAREFLQMLHRCRHLTNKQINIHVKTGITKNTNKVNDLLVSNYIKKHQQLKVGDDDWWSTSKADKKNSETIIKYLIDEFYFNVLINNIGEKIDSEKNYSQELLGRLTYNHNINVNIIPKYELENIDNVNEDYREKTKEYSNENMINLMSVNKLSKTEFDKINEKQNDKKTSEESLQQSKFKTMNALRNNYSNNKYLMGLPKPHDYISNYNDGDDFYYSGVFTNYLIDKLDNTLFYNHANSYLQTPHNQIIRMEYDKDHLIKHSLNIAMIHSKKIIKTMYRLNHNILTNKEIEDNETDINEITSTDMEETNKLHIIKHVLKILDIDRMKLVYDRYITTNQLWRDLFDENRNFIENQFNKYIKEMDIKNMNETNKHISISNYNSKNRVQYRYVKDKIIHLLKYIGITTLHYFKCGNRSVGHNTEKDNNFIVIQYELQDKYISEFMFFELRKQIARNRTFINTYYDTIKNDLYYFINKKNILLNETINEDVLQYNLKLSKRTRITKCDTLFYETHNYNTRIIKKKRRLINITWNTETDLPNEIELPYHIFSKTYTTNKLNENVILDLKDDKNNNKLYTHHQKDYDDLNKDIADYINHNFNTSIQPKFIYEDINKTKNDISYYRYEGVKWNKKKDDTYNKTTINKYTTNKNKAEQTKLIMQNENHATSEADDKSVIKDVLNGIVNSIILKYDYTEMLNNKINTKNALINVKNDILNGTLKTNSNDIFNNIIRPNIKPTYIKKDTIHHSNFNNKCMIEVN